jgi:hypothetical protein
MADDQVVYFTFRGDTFTLSEDFTLGEIGWINKHLGLDVAEMGAGTRFMVSMFMMVRRDPRYKYFTAKTFEHMRADEFEPLDDAPQQGDSEEEEEEAEEVDPTGGLVPDPAEEDSRTSSDLQTTTPATGTSS